MGSTRRTVLTTKHKAVLWFLGLLFLWEVLQSNAVLEAFLTFGFAGVIPGTNIVLSPDSVIMVTGIALVLLFIAIVLRLLLKRPKERIPANLERATEALVATPVAADISAPAPIVLQHDTTPKASSVLSRIIEKLRVLGTSMRRRLIRIVGITLEWLDVKTPAVARALQRVSQIVWAIGMIVFVFVRKWTITAVRYAKQKITAFWQWLVPYLWKFDTWLELRVRALTKWARYKSRQYNSLTVLIGMYRQYKKLYSESPIAAFFKTPSRQSSRQEDEV